MMIEEMSRMAVTKLPQAERMVFDYLTCLVLVERKDGPLSKMIAKCRQCIITVQIAKHVIENLKHQTIDMACCTGVNDHSLRDLLKEIQLLSFIDTFQSEYYCRFLSHIFFLQFSSFTLPSLETLTPDFYSLILSLTSILAIRASDIIQGAEPS
jgi:hypothetical protein